MKKYLELKFISKIAVVIFIISIISGLYIIINNIGLIEGLNFGPGQYYYTDIPNWQKYFLTCHYFSDVSNIIILGLFFTWGYIMYKVWSFLDRII